ncbi:MAG: hypothetical protein ACXVGB_00080 [Mycobacteriaceae bacterium]
MTPQQAYFQATCASVVQGASDLFLMRLNGRLTLEQEMAVDELHRAFVSLTHTIEEPVDLLSDEDREWRDAQVIEEATTVVVLGPEDYDRFVAACNDAEAADAAAIEYDEAEYEVSVTWDEGGFDPDYDDGLYDLDDEPEYGD